MTTAEGYAPTAPVSVAPSAAAAGASLGRRLTWFVAAAAAGVVLAGLWNYQVVDGIGRDVIAGGTIGDPEALAGTYGQHGAWFGLLFGMVAGLAATFTACNCVVFAMLPGLACSTDRAAGRRDALRALGRFVAGVLLVAIPYGMFIGFLGAEGIALFNERAVRLARANAIFSAIGMAMLVWGALDLGFADPLKRAVSETTRAYLARPTTKAAIMGVMVGLFMIGRPFPVMADFQTYAAASGNPLYGALVMSLQGLGQIAVMVVAFLVIIALFGRRLGSLAVERPALMARIGALALVAGGAYFVFYWGLAFSFDIGRWGFKLGWY